LRHLQTFEKNPAADLRQQRHFRSFLYCLSLH
jgi:hypothetical protein